VCLDLVLWTLKEEPSRSSRESEMEEMETVLLHTVLSTVTPGIEASGIKSPGLSSNSRSVLGYSESNDLPSHLLVKNSLPSFKKGGY
jgi:hypothetical protein